LGTILLHVMLLLCLLPILLVVDQLVSLKVPGVPGIAANRAADLGAESKSAVATETAGGGPIIAARLSAER
jgi:hypothetical protein